VNIKKIIPLVGMLGLLLMLIASFFLPGMMKPPPRHEVAETMARQELQYLYTKLERYKSEHEGKLPDSISELQKATDYLAGMTADAYRRTTAQLVFPFASSNIVKGPGVLASYRANDGRLFMLLEGGVITNN
jgi:hypothetical protein